MIVLTWSRPSDVVKLRFFYRWKLVKWGWAAPRSFIRQLTEGNACGC